MKDETCDHTRHPGFTCQGWTGYLLGLAERLSLHDLRRA